RSNLSSPESATEFRKRSTEDDFVPVDMSRECRLTPRGSAHPSYFPKGRNRGIRALPKPKTSSLLPRPTADGGKIRKKERTLPHTPAKGLITVIPLDRADEDVLRVVADSLQGILRLPVDLHDVVRLPEHTFMESRDQYNAMAIIKHLDKELALDSLKVLGVTGRDICNPILTYVFGEAYMGGRSAVMSCARLRIGASGLPISREDFLERAVKVAIHEIGHTFGLPHCHTDRCVMRASHNVPDLDTKLNYLCDYCELFLQESLTKLLKEIEVETRLDAPELERARR
ncbi:MAG: archaemetzincin family Zn-dependent metalloprotease, partial [Desulfomonilaceae bacterium]|nr:archaemetzincin family Zn-dependent metalloprotease [Desulfomonilaceae bacterium]